MPARRKIIMGICLGIGLLGAVAVGAASWVWMPDQRADLSRQTTQLETRIDTMSQHVREWHQSRDGDLDLAVSHLPTRTGLPGWAGELLAELSAAGATHIRYTLGEDRHRDNLASRTLETQFEATVNDLGNIFDHITGWRPGVSIGSLEMEVGQRQRIDVTMDLTLLGNNRA